MAGVTTEAQVCNLALGLVGHRQFLLDLVTEDSAEAEVCRQYYAQVRNKCLEAWPWSFATKRVVLSLTTETRTGWGYCYSSPADMLSPQRIWSGYRRPGQGQPVPFALELSDDNGQVLVCTDMALAELIYTVEQKTVALWTAAFADAVAAALAVRLAGALPVKAELMRGLEPTALLALRSAAALDANKQQLDEEAESETIRERG